MSEAYLGYPLTKEQLFRVPTRPIVRTLLMQATRVSELLDLREYRFLKKPLTTGPVMAYLSVPLCLVRRYHTDIVHSAKVSNATDLNVTGLKWFKAR